MFKKLFLLVLLSGLFSTGSKAQFRYTFKDTTMPYVSVPGTAFAANNGFLWDDEDFTVPVGFSWTLDSTIQLSTVTLALMFPGFTNTGFKSGRPLTGFMPVFTDLVDRGNVTRNRSLSPIGYLTTGAAPNRIFKMEMLNAGFRDEQTRYNTLTDSAYIQFWIYEGSNIVELHYGPSRVTRFNDYFKTANGGPAAAVIAFVQNVDISATTGEFYYLSGLPAAPVVKSISLPAFPSDGLTAWPANGQVYRLHPN